MDPRASGSSRATKDLYPRDPHTFAEGRAGPDPGAYINSVSSLVCGSIGLNTGYRSSEMNIQNISECTVAV